MFDRSGEPIDRGLLRAMTQFLSYVGPDDRETYENGSFGFGHTMLRTTGESGSERQPGSLDGRLWITADARIDCRDELRKAIEKESSNAAPATDSELILQAYAIWGEDCAAHLRGDFAFGIWDGRRQTLFCVRDHFGIKPFYYAEIGNVFLFSNVFDCVRLHPGLSEELNDAAIGDFLLFGLNCDLGTSIFRDVRRLPPAHCLSVSAGNIKIRRYWSAPTSSTIRYRRADEYVEHFQTLFQSAVADRLRSDPVGILLSGGLDSGAVAATAREITGSPSASCTSNLRAFTVVHQPVVSDSERLHARKMADFLQIPLQFIELNGLRPFERWNEFQSNPQPIDDPLFAGLFDQFKAIAAECRVVLSGEGADNLMHFEMWPYVKYMWRNREFKRLLQEVPSYLRQRPSVWPGVSRRIKGVFGKDPTAPAFPQWLAPEFSRRLGLVSRWREWTELPLLRPHPILPKAHASLAIPQWAHMFEQVSPGFTHCPVEVRYPFLDLRIVNYVLALPPFPFFFEKKLLRDTMVGHLPEISRVRPKTPLLCDPLVDHFQHAEPAEWLGQVQWSAGIEEYIDRSALASLRGEKNAERISLALRPYCFNFWLQSGRRVRYNLLAEVRNA